jgi:3-oxoadipate enol-lactonase
MIDVGTGPPLVLIPGIQGRWEWMYPFVAALAQRFRVLSFTLAGEWTSRQPLDPRLGFDSFIVQVDRILEHYGVESATICGVSYGGLIATRYAALRPDRTRHLVLVSALPPDYEPDQRFQFYARSPALMLPIFFVDSARRAAPELRAAFPRWSARVRFQVAQSLRVLSAPASPNRMRDRMRLLAGVDLVPDAGRVRAPALLITGSDGLDRTVPVELTRRYLACLGQCEVAELENTGHLGTVTRPDRLAAMIAGYVDRTQPRPALPLEEVHG